MAHDPAWLQARRLASNRRRRRRRLERALALLTVAFAAAAVAVASSGNSGRAHAGSARPRLHPRAAPVGPAPGFNVRPHSVLAVELAAALRLARYGLPLYCGGSRGRMVALTFDDGPGIYTHYAIKKLREFHAHATFFLVGKEIRAWPALARREKPVAAVGDHTMTHPFLPALSDAEMVHEIAEAKRLIERAAGQPVVLFRPPYEGLDAAIEAEVKKLGMLDVLWDVDSADSLGANYAGIEHNVIEDLFPGSIVEMHENRGQTIRALPVIFAALARRHLRAVTLLQLIAQDPPTIAQLRQGFRGCPVVEHMGNGH